MRTTFYTLLIVCFGLLGSWDTQAQSGTNCPPLTPFCQDLNTSYMPGACMVEVWAKDFISKINDGSEPLDSFWISFHPDTLQMNYIFMSEDGSQQTILIYINDGCSYTICEVELDINDNTGECPVSCCIANDWTGWAATTCTADSVSIINGIFDDQVGILYDVRYNSQAPRGDDWANPFTTGASSVGFIEPSNWKLDEIGQIFGIAVDGQSNVFIASSDVYARDYNTLPQINKPCGAIYKAQPPLFNAVLFATLPVQCETLNGIGNIVYDNTNNQLFATNLDDGKIYRISSGGTVLETYDPFANEVSSASGNGITSQAEQIWGIGLNEEGNDLKLYFPRIQINGTSQTREMWSLTLESDGSFPVDNSETLEISGVDGIVPRITDIAFSRDGSRMLFTERGTTNLDQAHIAKTISYNLTSGVWEKNIQYFVGAETISSQPQFAGLNGENSAGGVAFGFVEEDSIVNQVCDDLIWVSGNIMEARLVNQPTPRGLDFLYGIQGIAYSGNNAFDSGSNANQDTDIFIDYDGQYDFGPKGNIGDVEIFNCSSSLNSNHRESNITGQVITTALVPFSNVEVHLSSETVLDMKYSSVDGRFSFDIESEESYMVKPEYNDDPIDGLSTLDLLLIQKHILGLNSFSSPFEMVAADVNGSGNISTNDMVELRRMILGRQEEFQSKSVWNFYPQESLNSGDMELFENYKVIDNIDRIESHTFVGIKTGDVNFNNSTVSAQTRSLDKAILGYSRELNTYNIKIPSFEKGILGFQMEMELHDASLKEILIDNVTISQEYYDFEDGILRISYNANRSLSKEDHELSIALDGLDNEEEIEILRGNFTSELYFEDFSVKQISLSSMEVGIAKATVFPNPSSGDAILQVLVEESTSPVSLKLYGISGKVISLQNVNLDKGLNEISLDEIFGDVIPQGMSFLEVTTLNSIYAPIRIVRL